MGTKCASLVAEIFLFCYEKDFIMYLCDDKHADSIDAFDTTSRYLDVILNIINVYFRQYCKSNIPFKAPFLLIQKPHS